jgi:hypothetical protein
VRSSEREASRFVDINADTWRAALEPGERSFVAVLVGRDGKVRDVWQYAREQGSPRVKHGRKAARR